MYVKSFKHHVFIQNPEKYNVIRNVFFLWIKKFRNVGFIFIEYRKFQFLFFQLFDKPTDTPLPIFFNLSDNEPKYSLQMLIFPYFRK